jgi:hypothetical protein
MAEPWLEEIARSRDPELSVSDSRPVERASRAVFFVCANSSTAYEAFVKGKHGESGGGELPGVLFFGRSSSSKDCGEDSSLRAVGRRKT